MSYTNLINKNLNLAFNLIGDLSTDFIFTKTENNSFNFSNSVVSSNTVSVATKGLVVKSEKNSQNTNVINKEIIVKSAELGDIKAFDSVSIQNTTWKLGNIIQDSGYIIRINIFREV